MTHEHVKSMLKAIEMAEQAEFREEADAIFVNGVTEIEIAKMQAPIYCNVKQFYLDDEIRCGKVICIKKDISCDDEDNYSYLVRFKDDNHKQFCEVVYQICVGDLSKLTDYLREYKKIKDGEYEK